MKKLSFNIIGAGAMGHLWASFLLHAGYCVRLYSRTQMEADEFLVQSPLGQFKQKIEYSTLSHWQDAEVILVCVKAHQLEQLCLELVQKQINPDCLVLLMNGMGLIEIVEQHLPLIQSIHASIVHGVYLKEKKIIHTGNGQTILGNLNTNFSPESFNLLIEQLDQVLPQVSWNHNHQQAMNLKLIINAIINPITALNNQTNQSLLLNGKLNPEAEDLLNELKPLLLLLLPEMPYQSIKQQIESVAFNTRDNISSMLQDVRSGKKTEINFINGYLVSYAKANNINIPRHSELILKIKQLS